MTSIFDPWDKKESLSIVDPWEGKTSLAPGVQTPDMASITDPWDNKSHGLADILAPKPVATPAGGSSATPIFDQINQGQGQSMADLLYPKRPSPVEAPPAPKNPTMAGELGKGIMQGLYQMKEMGGGLLALTGEALKSASSVMEPIAEPIKGYGIDVLTGAQKDMEKYQGAVPSYKNIGGVQDALYYLSHGVGTLLPMVGMSMVSGGIGAAAGKAIAKNYVTTLATQLASRGVAKEAINEAVKQGLLRGLERGALLGGGASSLAMEAGGITGEVVREKQEIEPGRIMAGALPAAALDVLPQFSLIKRTGILQRLGLSKLESELTEEAAKKIPHSFLGRIGKEAGKQFLMEAPTEAMQSVLERWAERKDLTAPESIDDYIDSFLIGGAGGALFGGLGGAFEKRPTPRVAPPPETPPPVPPAAPVTITPAPGPAIPPIKPEVAKPPVAPQEGQKPLPPSPATTPGAKPTPAPIPAAPAPEKATIAVPPKEEIARGPVAEKPAAPAAAPEAPKPSAKEPWEMTREEYLAQSEDISQMRKLRQEEEGLSLSTPKDKRFATTALNAAIRNEKARHEESVRKAMTEGKPIPTEVLTDYPDLAPKTPQRLSPAGKILPEQAKRLEEIRKENPEEATRIEKGNVAVGIQQYELARMGKANQMRQGEMFAPSKAQEEIFPAMPGEYLKPGDFIEFKTDDGRIVKGKIRDVDYIFGRALVFPADRSLIKNPDMASISIPIERIVGKQSGAMMKPIPSPLFRSQNWMKALKENRTGDAWLSFLMENSPDESQRLLANALLENSAIQKQVKELPFTIFRDWFISDSGRTVDTSHYEPSKHVVRLSETRFERYSPYKAGSTVLHEILHGLTTEKMRSDRKFNLAVSELRMQAIQKGLSAREKEIFSANMTEAFLGGKEMQYLGLTEHPFKIYYGLHNNDEFLSELFSSADFQNFLRTIPKSRGIRGVGNISLWDRFIDFLNKVFFENKDRRNLLSQALTIGAEIAQTERAGSEIGGEGHGIKAEPLFEPHPMPQEMQENLDNLNHPSFPGNVADDPKFDPYLGKYRFLIHVPDLDLKKWKEIGVLPSELLT